MKKDKVDEIPWLQCLFDDKVFKSLSVRERVLLRLGMTLGFFISVCSSFRYNFMKEKKNGK